MGPIYGSRLLARGLPALRQGGDGLGVLIVGWAMLPAMAWAARLDRGEAESLVGVETGCAEADLFDFNAFSGGERLA